MAQVTWGLITQVTPTVQVRFVGDSLDTLVVQGNSSLTLATNDRVKLTKVGTQWLVDYVIGDL